MSAMRKKNKRVVVALRLSTLAGRRTLQGIYRYLNENRIHWDVQIKCDSDELDIDSVMRFPDWNIDGIIFGIHAPSERMNLSVGEIARQNIPIVAVDVLGQYPALDERRDGIAFVTTNRNSVGAEAARFFLTHGIYRSFGYVPDCFERGWSTLRREAFVAELERAGLACSSYEHPVRDKDNPRGLRQWLRSLKKPAAVLAACDVQALPVLEACMEENLRIPRDVSVLGVDDDELIDESCDPTLSSVRPNHERHGFIAASRLCRMMAGNTNVPRNTEIAILGITERESTSSESPAEILVQNAMSYIERNVRYGLDPAAVAHHLKVSRSLLDMRFREIRNASVNATIRDLQLANVKERLRRTNDPIDRVAELCGFSNANYLKTLFKRSFGMTMREYRNRNAHSHVRQSSARLHSHS